MRVFHITIIVGLAICLGTATAQRKTTKKPTDAPAYDDYDDYEGAAEDDASAAAKKAPAANSSTTTTAPVEEDDSAKGSHPFFKNRFKLRARPSPHPAVKTKPTLPSFIKHPANIEDLGHEVPHEKKPTQAPLPRPKPTSAKPHKFSSYSSTAYRKKPVPKEQPKDDYDYEETNEDTKPKSESPKPSATPRPLRPRTRQ